MLPTTVSFVILITAVLCTPYVVVNNNITLVILSGNIRVEITKPVWGMNIFNNATGKALIKECINGCQNSKPKLGFGWWEGTYFDLYQGYLWRLGEITEWYEATRVISVRYGKHDVWINVATTDPKNRTVTAHFYDLCDQKLSFEFLVEPANGANRVAWGFDVIYKDRFLGFGERFNGVGQVGNVGSWTEDGSWSVGKIFPDARIPGGAASTYFPMPLFLRSSAGYGFQLNTFFRSEIDVRDSTVTMLVESRHFDATIFVGDNVRATFMLMTEQNGRSLIPPPWTFGPWNQLKSERAGVNATTRAQQMLLEDDIPFSLNIDPVHFFPAGDDIGREDQLKQNNLNLLYMGIPSVAYFNAMVEDKWTTVYKEAAEKGYFTKNVSGDPYQFLYLGAKLFNVSQIDFTNLDAVAWYQKHLERAVDVHYKGWMYDYGEYTPPDSLNSLNQSGLQSHNQYPLLYQKACFDFFTENYSNDSNDSKYAPDYLFYVRSGYLGSARYTWAHWTGDPSSDWTPGSGIPAQLQAMLSIGISGIPFTGSGIGGFEWYLDEPPTLELWVRWTQLGAFSGLMQEEGSGKGIGRKTHIFDTPTGTRLWRKFAKLRMQLFPYIYTQAHIAHATGLPIMRHHVLDFYNDITAMGQDFQFMFGECFLVSPIVKEGETVHKVYLPKGENWIDGIQICKDARAFRLNSASSESW